MPPPPPPGRPQYQGTRLESAEEVRDAVSARKAASASQAPLLLTPVTAAGPVPPAPVAAAAADDTALYRPTRRPSIAMLCIVDDGKDDGEWIRLRSDECVIGRSEGDIVIPHDGMMSGRHAMLSRRLHGDTFRWMLNDLGSTNGTFVRVGDSLLRSQQEILIGSKRFKFDAAAQGAAMMAEAEKGGDSTRGWAAVSPTQLIPSIVEIKPEGEGQRFYLTKPDNWIGRDARACAVVLTDDPYVSPLHARIYKDPQARWHVENLKSLNGTWLRFDEVPCGTACQFQLGEQRFVLRVL